MLWAFFISSVIVCCCALKYFAVICGLCACNGCRPLYLEPNRSWSCGCGVTAKNPLGIYIFRIDIETIEQYVGEHLKEKLSQMTLFDLRLRQEEEVRAEKV